MTTAFILAGGLGLRLRREVSGIPKPMAPINGHPFLEYLLNYWVLQGVTKFILSVCYLHKNIIKYFGNSFKNIPIVYFIEKFPMGTGGGLLKICSQIKGDFIVLNGDTFLNISLSELHDLKRVTKADMVLTIVKKKAKKRYEQVLVNQKKIVTKIVKSNIINSNFINGGVYLINSMVLNKIKNNFYKNCSFESEVLPKLLLKGYLLAGLKHNGKFIDIGLPSDYKRAKIILKKLK